MKRGGGCCQRRIQSETCMRGERSTAVLRKLEITNIYIVGSSGVGSKIEKAVAIPIKFNIF